MSTTLGPEDAGTSGLPAWFPLSNEGWTVEGIEALGRPILLALP